MRNRSSGRPARAVVVPLGWPALADAAALRRAAPDAVVLEDAAAIADGYRLFLGAGTVPPLGSDWSSAEYLIDRDGYLRARWRPGEPDDWEDLTWVQGTVTSLVQKPSGALRPDAHAH